MNECFMCARLTAAAQAAEKKAEEARVDATSAEGVADYRKARIKEMKKAIVVVLRAAEGFPRPLVIPHVAPRSRPRADGPNPDRFSLVELE